MNVVWVPIGNAHLERALRFQRWACVFYGMALLSSLQVAASWLDLRVLSAGIVFWGSILAYVVLRELSKAATRRWQKLQAEKFVHDIFADGGHGE